MGRELEDLVNRAAVQLDGLERREQDRDRKIDDHATRIAKLETAIGYEGKQGEQAHQRFGERLKAGDEDLQELRDKAAKHSGSIRGIQEALERAEVNLTRASGRRWDLAQIVITALVGILCSILAVGVSAALIKIAPPPAAVKGASP